jgi:hypothetical protein
VRGDIRKAIVLFRVPYTINEQKLIDSLQYRLYVKEGPNEYTVVDYQDIEMTFNQNYFLIDTESLIPNRYWIDIKMVTNRDIKTIKDVVNFNIVGIVDFK